mgnify:FL=1
MAEVPPILCKNSASRAPSVIDGATVGTTALVLKRRTTLATHTDDAAMAQVLADGVPEVENEEQITHKVKRGDAKHDIVDRTHGCQP